MKIAIKGDELRGKKVIQILENLGGENRYDQSGSNEEFIYFINNVGLIYSVPLQTCSNERRIYTLEEFEKEFPFKIGDKVQNIYSKNIGTIVKICYNPATTIAYKVQYNLDHKWLHSASQLELYKEMKKERNITLTLEKAKEWYNKGGDLKQVALQAFTEKELNPLPRSWEEFCEKYPVKETEAVICCDSSIADCKGLGEKRDSEYYRDICPSRKSAEAHLAMIQLEQLRNCWWGDWRPEWSNNEKYVIKWEGNNLIAFTARRVHAFLVFPTIEMAGEFLKCFRDLIEKAGDLI